MNKFCLMFVFSVLSLCGLASCSDDKEELIEEEVVVLADKPGYVFLDGGEYVEATTEFTDKEAIAVLKSKIWKTDSNYYIYDLSKIKKTHYKPDYMLYSFKDNGIYNWSYDLGKNFSKDYEYWVNDKNLIMHETLADIFGAIYSESWFYLKVVAVDEDRIILDTTKKISQTSIPNGFPEFDLDKTKLRYVWVAHAE